MKTIITKLQQFYQTLKPSHKKVLFRLFDYVSFLLVSYLALSLRFDIFTSVEYILFYFPFIIVSFFIKTIIFEILKIYDNVIRFLSKEFILNLLWAVLYTALALSFVVIVSLIAEWNIFVYPRSVIIIEIFLLYVITFGWRYICKEILSLLFRENEDIGKFQKNIAICLEGEKHENYLNFLNSLHHIKVQAIFDDTDEFIGRRIKGIQVFSQNELPEFIQKHSLDYIIIPLPYNEKKLLWIENIRKHNIEIRKLPPLSEATFFSEKPSEEIPKLDVTDLLKRQEIAPLQNIIDEELNGQTVVITGAGGSIGRELCKQVVNARAENLLLIENNEFALYKISQYLKDKKVTSNIHPYLCSVTDETTLDTIFSKHKPSIVYHTAAYKHVFLVEQNPLAGVFNNVIGSFKLAKICLQHKVAKVILVSTDKAVNPVNIMGKTKKAAELIFQAFAFNKESFSTKLITVRFGNVLDSDGSVIPRFREQIQRRENLTVSHLQAYRYFMSISEASSLIIQAGALGKNGDILMLDMGKQISIYQLAKDMIELSSLKLNRDININITGLLSSEKLTEELYLPQNTLKNTKHSKIKIVQDEEHMPFPILSDELSKLYIDLKQYNLDTVMVTLNRLAFYQKRSPH